MFNQCIACAGSSVCVWVCQCVRVYAHLFENVDVRDETLNHRPICNDKEFTKCISNNTERTSTDESN